MKKRKPKPDPDEMHLTDDQRLNVLADCQRILRHPKLAKCLVDGVAMLRAHLPTVKTLISPPADVPDLAQVRRATRLGIAIEFDRMAAATGEMDRKLYGVRFVYPKRPTTAADRKRFAVRLKRAIDRHINQTAAEAAEVF